MPKSKGSQSQAKENYGSASKQIGALWQEYKKSEHFRGPNALNYNTFRKEVQSRNVRSTLQGKSNEGSFAESHNSSSDSTHDVLNTAFIEMDSDEPMDVMDTGSGPNLGDRVNSGDSAPHSSSVQSSPIWLSRGNGSDQSTTLTFRKKRIFYSYGYAFQQIDVPNTPNDYPCSGIATPLASLWVDFLPSYLSFCEFMSLPIGATATKARVNVKVLGSRTSFETGSTLTGYANSEHVPVGIIATNINNKTYGKNMEYSASATTKPMVPDGIKDLNATNCVKKFYLDLPSMCMGVPRSAYGYWWYRQNKDIACTDSSQNKVPFKYGQLNLCDYTQQFLINSAIGKTIKTYSYNIKNGLINFPKHHVTNNAYRDGDLDIMAGLSLVSKASKQRDKDANYLSILYLKILY